MADDRDMGLDVRAASSACELGSILEHRVTLEQCGLGLALRKRGLRESVDRVGVRQR